MPIELDRRSVTHMQVCGASHFCIFNAPFGKTHSGTDFEKTGQSQPARSAHIPRRSHASFVFGNVRSRPRSRCCCLVRSAGGSLRRSVRLPSLPDGLTRRAGCRQVGRRQVPPAARVLSDMVKAPRFDRHRLVRPAMDRQREPR